MSSLINTCIRKLSLPHSIQNIQKGSFVNMMYGSRHSLMHILFDEFIIHIDDIDDGYLHYMFVIIHIT